MHSVLKPVASWKIAIAANMALNFRMKYKFIDTWILHSFR